MTPTGIFPRCLSLMTMPLRLCPSDLLESVGLRSENTSGTKTERLQTDSSASQADPSSSTNAMSGS
jgi:hypothetical protein